MLANIFSLQLFGKTNAISKGHGEKIRNEDFLLSADEINKKYFNCIDLSYRKPNPDKLKTKTVRPFSEDFKLIVINPNESEGEIERPDTPENSDQMIQVEEDTQESPLEENMIEIEDNIENFLEQVIEEVSDSELDEPLEIVYEPEIQSAAQETAQVSKGIFGRIGSGLRQLGGVLSAAGVSVINVSNKVVRTGTDIVKPTNFYKAGVAGANKIISSYEAGINKDKEVQIAKETIQETLENSQFNELFEFVQAFIGNEAERQIDQFYTGVVADIFPDKTLITDLIEITHARGLKNLVQQMYAQRANIPNFDHQPAWVNLILFLQYDASQVLNTEKLMKIEEKHQAILKEIGQKRELLSVKADNASETEALWNECLATDEDEKQIQILSKLYATWIQNESDKNADMRFFYRTESEFIKSLFLQDPDFSELFTLLDKKASYKLEIVALFGEASDSLIEKLFPNKILDMEVPGIFKKGPIPGLIYNFFQGLVKNALANQYIESKEDFLKYLSMVETGVSQLVDLFDIEKQRNQLREASGGEFFVSFSQALSKDMNVITKKILNEKELTQDILKTLGKTNPTQEEIEKMQAALEDLIFSLGRKKISAGDIEELLKKVASVEDTKAISQFLIKALAKLDGNTIPKDLVLKALLEKTIVKIARHQGGDQAEIEARTADLRNLSVEEIIELDAEQSFEQAQLEVKKDLRQLSQELVEEISQGLNENYTVEKVYQALESIIFNGNSVEENKAQLEQAADELAQEISFRGMKEGFTKDDIFTVLNGIAQEYEKKLLAFEQTVKTIDDQAQALASSMQSLINNFGKGKLDSKNVLETFKETFNIESVNSDKEKALKPLIEKKQGMPLSEEEIADMVQAMLPPGMMNIRPFIMDQVHGMFVSVDPSYKKNREFLQGLIEGVVVKIFTAAAEINAPQGGKPSEVVIIEKFLQLFGEFIGNLSKGEETPEEIAKGFSELLLKSVLGIATIQIEDGQPQFVLAEQLNWIPEAYRGIVLNAITEALTGSLVSRLNHFSNLSSTNENIQATKELLKKYDKVPGQEKSNVEVVVDDLMRLVMPAVLNSLVKEPEGSTHLSGVTKISSAIEGLIETLMAEGNQETAKVLFNYGSGEPFKEILGNMLLAAAGSDHEENKEEVLNRVVNLLLSPMDQVIEDALNFGGEKAYKKAEATQKVMGSMFKEVGPHFQIYARAQRLARWDGREKVSHSDLMRAGGKKIHAAVPRQAIQYQQTIDAIQKIVPDLSEEQIYTLRKRIMYLVRNERNKVSAISSSDIVNELGAIYQYASPGRSLSVNQIQLLLGRNENGKTLRDIIRQEAEAHSIQRNEFGFNPTSKKVAKRMFPNGKDDLTFVPPEDRAAVWKLLKTTLLPIILPIAMESVISPDTIKNIVLTSLKETNGALNGKIVIQDEENPGVSGPAEAFLGESAGEMLAGIIETMELPGIVKNSLIDPVTGQISPAMKQTLGKTLSKQFNERFIEETIKTALAAVANRDQNGNPVLNYDGRPEAIKKAQAAVNSVKMTEEIHKEAKNIVKASISNFVRTSWAVAQHKFDKSIEKISGRYGLGVKHVLDAIFRFVFFKVIGSVLSIALWPAKRLALEAIYRTVSLDKNLDTLLGMFDQLPEDQPEGYEYSVFNENLIYQMMEAMAKAVEEVADEEKVNHSEHVNHLVDGIIQEIEA